ncbi:Glutathione S-transferase 2 [Papilio xuthus]|uniref:glutathione transferase n=1 Tax=Papilio xuthus TaxID=66420 RepID=A0A194Q378_PAPXU|nr:Glutathione S-transferase 2 [Papilio xuthus]
MKQICYLLIPQLILNYQYLFYLFLKNVKVTYFDGAGTAEAIRWLLAYGGQEFEDIRVGFADWPALKPKTPHGVMPLLEFDGKVYGQSFAICRYLGKKFNLGGKTLEEDLVIDQNVDFYADVRSKGIQSFWEPDASIKAVKQEALVNTVYPELLPKLDKIIRENNGHMALGRLTWADFAFAGFYDGFKQQSLIPDFDEKYPSFKKLRETVANLPAIKKYLESKS